MTDKKLLNWGSESGEVSQKGVEDKKKPLRGNQGEKKLKGKRTNNGRKVRKYGI